MSAESLDDARRTWQDAEQHALAACEQERLAASALRAARRTHPHDPAREQHAHAAHLAAMKVMGAARTAAWTTLVAYAATPAGTAELTAAVRAGEAANDGSTWDGRWRTALLLARQRSGNGPLLLAHSPLPPGSR